MNDPEPTAPAAPVVPGQSLAVTAEALYLVNLMLAPGLGFALLAWLWLTRGRTAPPLARSHLRQTFFVSLWGGLLLVLACLGFVLLFGLDSGWTWTYVVIYFTCVHSSLILCGVLGLARALSGKTYRFPLIGPRLEIADD